MDVTGELVEGLVECVQRQWTIQRRTDSLSTSLLSWLPTRSVSTLSTATSATSTGIGFRLSIHQ